MSESEQRQETETSSSFSRRRLLGAAGLGAAAVAGGATIATRRGGSSAAASSAQGLVVPFYGKHQAGIVTPAQDRLHFAAFDVTTTSRERLIRLLKDWTEAAAKMTAGQPVGEFGAVDGPALAPPDDTGEALGLSASRLTITFGFGPSLFMTTDGVDRFGLGARQPASLVRLPLFPGDKLSPARSDGDLCVQACADDPQVAVHAIRNLARIAFGTASVRWSQLGFGRTSSTSTAQTTPRNLFGFKDGTANLKVEDPASLDEHVWVPRGSGAATSSWLDGGSYLVARRISMRIETWDRTSLTEQESVVGRTKGDGAPLSGGTEFSEPDFAAKGARDEPLLATASHVRLAHASANNGVRILRRGYNFTDGTDGLGRLDAGLFFLAFVRDPVTHYIPMQLQLSKNDSMMEYLQHTGSGLFAVPPGVAAAGGFVGEGLFA
jgi:deferrochelatase/peroxidase EfeB